MNPEPAMDIVFERGGNIEGALRNVHRRAITELRGGNLQLLLIVLPEVSGSHGM